MTGEIEAAGDIATGGLIARTFEPRGGSAEGDGGVCLNCATALAGGYCHRCGQPAHIHRSLAAFWHDLAHGVLHFEGKVWRTLPLLAWRPGELTRRYIEGERARFVSPLALFLFSVFLMFAVISMVAGPLAAPDTKKLVAGRAAAEIQAEIDAQTVELTELDRRRPTSGADAEAWGAERDKLANSIGDNRDALEAIENMGIPNQLHSDVPWLDRAIKKAADNPNLLLYKLQTNAYKFSWALIPISAPFLWLIFAWRRQYRLYDHAVFVTYSLAFMTLFVVALTVAGAAGLGAGAISLLAIFVPPLHIYRQLRGAYRLRRRNAALRTLALLVFASVALTAFILLLLALGLLG